MPTKPDKTPSGIQPPQNIIPPYGVLSYNELEQLWIEAGGDPNIASTMAAIALAESGGRAWAFNPKDTNGRGGTQVSAGLWQISNGTMHAVADWSDPLTNAKYAVAKYKEQGLQAWGTYTTGKYLSYAQGGSITQTGTAQQLISETPVRSTNVYSVGPYFADGTLFITFQDGRQYLYQGVPATVVHQLLNSPSVGAFVNRVMRNFDGISL